MNIAAHMQKVRQFDAARRRLHPLEDFELWYWAMISAGTHAINAALHALGASRESRRFATQVPGVDAVPDSQDAWHYEIAGDCDLIHVGIPELPSVPPQLEHAFEAMHGIERYRDPCIRGEHPVTPELLRTVEQAYATVRRVTGAVLDKDCA